MKIQTLILAGCATLLFACNKREDSTTPINTLPVGDPNAMKYSINGITDKSMKWTDSVVMPLSLVYGSGNQEKLTLSAVDLPANMSAKFEPESGIPSFATLLTLRSNGVAGGKHTIKIKATTAKDSVKTFDLVLDVKGIETCYTDRLGIYTNEMEKSDYPYITTENTVLGGPDYNQVTIKQVQTYMHGKQDIDVIVDCNNFKLWVVEKAAAGWPLDKITGSGSFTDKTMTLDVNIGFDTYKLKMTRK